jgi:hypothetical protein
MGKVIYFEEDIKQKAAQCKTTIEFRDKYEGYYNAAKRLNIFDHVCSHMTFYSRVKYDENIIEKEAAQYITKYDFRMKSPGAYNAANRKGILEKVCRHMVNQNGSIPQKICKLIKSF